MKPNSWRPTTRVLAERIAEISELRGLHTRDAESIKAFITRRWEHWTPKYREYTVRFPRRLLMIGTTNEDEFLSDTTGERRWLPVRVSGADAAAIARDRDQLWAEGVALWMGNGVAWRDAEQLARAEHAEFKIRDPWMETVQRWLQEFEPELGGSDGEPRDARPFLAADVLVGALGFERKHLRRSDEMRIGKVLQILGYTRRQVQVSGQRNWRWGRR
jgi:predicted P-loop ATPase